MLLLSEFDKEMALSYVENFLKECPLTLIYTVVLLLLGFLYFKLKSNNIPPGPWGLPFVGYWPYIKFRDYHFQFQELTKKYGEIFTFNVTGQLYIHLSSLKSIKEVHLNKSDCFINRTTAFTALLCFFNEGVISANGEAWKLLRKFFLQMFREYGISSGKDITGSIQDSVNSAMEHLRAANEAPVDVVPAIAQHCSAVLRRMLFNDDGMTIEEQLEINQNYFIATEFIFDKRVLLAGKVAKYVILPLDPRFKNSTKSFKRLIAILDNIAKRHKDTLDEQNIRNIIDSYYKERNEKKKRGDPSAKYFTDKALVSSLLQILGDGVFAVTAYVTYCLDTLIKYPDEQQKIFEELENVIGPDRQPSLDDKNNLPYTNAFILEASRTSDLLTLFPTVECTKETTIGGYKIPKGAIAVINFWAAHRDPNVYDEPNTFKPARFLKGPGKEKAELPVLFGVGKRSCIGESYTALQTFLFIATVVKNFRLEAAKGTSCDYREGKLEIVLRPRMNK